MLKAIFKQELRLLLRKKLLWVLMPLLLLFTLTVTIAHWHQQQTFQATQAHWQELNNEHWQAQPDRHPHRVAHYGSLAFRLASPLTFLDAGVNPYTGNALFLEAHGRNSPALRQFAYSAGQLPMGYLSVATVVLILWPLLLIAIGFGSVSDERESGRLRLLVPLGVNNYYLLMGKGLAYLALSVAFLIALFAIAAIFIASADWPDKTDAWLRLPLLFLLYTGYCALWSALLVSVSGWARSNAQSLISLVLLWVALVIVIPQSLPWVAQQLYPLPDRAGLEVRIDQAMAQVAHAHDPDDPHFAEFRAKVLERYGVETIEELPVNWKGLVMLEGERLNREVLEQEFAEVQAIMDRQTHLRNGVALFSPYLLASRVSQRLVGSDQQAFTHFENQAEDYRYQLVQQLNQLQTDHIEHENDPEQTVGPEFWQEIPLFQHRPETLSDWSRSSLWFSAGGMLWLWLLPVLIIVGQRRRALL